MDPVKSEDIEAPKIRPQASDNKYAKHDKEQGLKGDYAALGLLMLLYTLQGVPMGLGGSVPLLLASKGVSKSAQAAFSIVSWPFSIKLLWAPLVDSVYSGFFGRRKTWIVPAQAGIGALLLWASPRVDVWLGGSTGEEPNVGTLTTLFLCFYFLAATQDVAVDGLALTILSPRNKELGATCNAIGQSVGFFLAYLGLQALGSADFCNNYLRSVPVADVGVVTLGSFMGFWAYVFFASTLWVAVAKGDEHEPIQGSVRSNLITAYREMGLVLKLPAVRSLALVLLTCKAAMGVFDTVSTIELVEAGVPNDHIALLSSALFPVSLLTQVYISGKYFAGSGGEGGKESKALTLWVECYPSRLVLGALGLALVLIVPYYKTPSGLPLALYAVMFFLAALESMLRGTMFVAQMAFYNRVSDPAIGGTYMTMLNTISNLGSAWPNTAALWIVGATTVKRCVPRACPDSIMKRLSEGIGTQGADCGCDDVKVVNGFVVTVVISLVVGVLWYSKFRKRVAALQELPAASWLAAH